MFPEVVNSFVTFEPLQSSQSGQPNRMKMCFMSSVSFATLRAKEEGSVRYSNENI